MTMVDLLRAYVLLLRIQSIHSNLLKPINKLHRTHTLTPSKGASASAAVSLRSAAFGGTEGLREVVEKERTAGDQPLSPVSK
jgi:hypothetical protein